MGSILVLLATFNGRRHLPEQLDSILEQRGVSVHVLVADDGSTDGTVEYLRARAGSDARIEILTTQPSGGGPAGNFYRLIDAVGPERLAGVDAVALSDQDDRWKPRKLARQLATLVVTGSDGVSSNVVAFYPNGRTVLVKKDYPQRAFDYLLESPGPACSFLLSPRLVELVRSELLDPGSPARHMVSHDWLIYGICRAKGWRWSIGAESTLDYRQHSANAVGVNDGARAKTERLRLMARRWHRGEATKMADVALRVSGPDTDRSGLLALRELFDRTGPRARVELVRWSPQLRRRPLHRAAIGLLVLGGAW